MRQKPTRELGGSGKEKAGAKAGTQQEKWTFGLNIKTRKDRHVYKSATKKGRVSGRGFVSGLEA